MVNAYDKCVSMRGTADYLYEVFDRNPTEHNNTQYDIALREWHDFCEQVVLTLMDRAPEVLRCIEVQEDEGLCGSGTMYRGQGGV